MKVKDDPIHRRFVLLRTDAHGTRRFVGVALTRYEAQQIVRSQRVMRAGRGEQAYAIHEYELGTLSEFLRNEKILA